MMKAPSAVALTVGGPYGYDGKAHFVQSATVTGIKGSTLGNATVSYQKAGAPAPAPTDAGDYGVTASFGGNTNYAAATSQTGTLTITKATASISFAGLTPTYDGAPKPVVATTNPAGLGEVTVTYDGSTTAPTNAGPYAIAATLTNNNYELATA